MAKCKDCIHYEACAAFSKIINAARDVEQGCEHFKDRTNFVEVVRCKDCKHSSCNPVKLTYACNHPLGLRGFLNEGFYFCSHGERKNGK